jgi:hypothetical protein
LRSPTVHVRGLEVHDHDLPVAIVDAVPPPGTWSSPRRNVKVCSTATGLCRAAFFALHEAP